MAVILSTSMIISTSCSKDKVKGCTDPDSKNYSSIAEEDDGSCRYEGSVVFWYNKLTSENLYDDGSDALTFYVDGNVVGSTNVTQYWNSAPNCGDNASITVVKDLGKVKTQAFSYRVIDDIGDEIWSGTVNFNANSCLKMELSYNK